MNRQRFMSGLRARELAVAAGLWSFIHFPLRSISVVDDHSLGDYFRLSASFPRLSPADRGTFLKVVGRLMAALAAAVAPFSLSPHGFQWIIFHTFRAGPGRAQRRRLASPAFAPPSGPLSDRRAATTSFSHLPFPVGCEALLCAASLLISQVR